MIRKTTYLLLFLFSILGKDIAGLGLNIWYWTNKAEITRKFCENKSRPMMNCNGQCYLAKKLKRIAFQEYQKENQKNKPVKPAKTPLFREDLVLEIITENAETYSKPSFFSVGRSKKWLFVFDIFHPPCT